MKTKALRFGGRYLAALRDHLAKPSAASLREVAHILGQQAHHLQMTIGDMIEVHVQSLDTLTTPGFPVRSRNRIIRSGNPFINSVSQALERDHRITRANTERLKIMIASLTTRTKDLAAVNKNLKSEIAQRLSAERLLKSSEQKSLELLGDSRRMQLELRSLSRRLLHSHEEERKRISRELHDVVAQALTGINVRLDSLKTHSTAHAKELHEKIATAQKLVHESVEIVHRFARDLRPSVLDDLGLIPALKSLLKIVEKEGGFKISVTAFPDVEKLEVGVKTVLYRVVQEALSNITRHAEATRVTVRISLVRERVRMTIHDNGKGFVTNAPTTAKSVTHLGLLGMRERVEMIDGTFHIISRVGKHTTIRVILSSQKTEPTPTKSESVIKHRKS